jgi:hypothetical protein
MLHKILAVLPTYLAKVASSPHASSAYVNPNVVLVCVDDQHIVEKMCFLEFTTNKDVGQIKFKAKMMNLESILHATTFLQRDKVNCYIFQTKQSWHFTQWDPGGRLFIGGVNIYGKLLIRIRTRGRVLQRWRRLMQEGFLSNFIVFYFSQILVIF